MLTRTGKPEIMIVDEVAAWLRCSTITVYRMAQRGEIPCSRVGRLYRFRTAELDAWQAIRDAESGRPVGGQAGRARSLAGSGVKPASKT
jgi:excisionase family DNA binding protein